MAAQASTPSSMVVAAMRAIRAERLGATRPERRKKIANTGATMILTGTSADQERSDPKGGAPSLRAGALEPQVAHRVRAVCGIVRDGGAHQLAVLEASHAVGRDFDAFAQHALVRACVDNDAVAADRNVRRHRLPLRK